MHKVNLRDIRQRERQSPTGKFGARYIEISVALGREPQSFDLEKRHPFDLTLVTIPSGRSLCPYHSHSSESELYLVVSGRGRIRHRQGWTTVAAGDAFFFGPGEAHQLTNDGDDEFIYYVIADNPLGDTCYYPDSGKFAVWKEGLEEVIIKAQETDYWDGEE
jgi:uncharacterized cupin superfamily protein